MLAPARFASPASVVNPATSQSTPALRSRSLEFLNARYSAISLRPARRARCSASDNAAAHASSSSPIFVCDGIMSAEPSPTYPVRNPIDMTPSFRIIKDLLTVLPAISLFLLICANPLAQSNKLPAPTGHVSDFAGVIDAQTKARLESLLQKVKEKSKIELYVAVVDSTGEQEISTFSQPLAREWNIGAQTSRTRTLLLVVSSATKTAFTQSSRIARPSLPEGVLGEMSYRMQGPLSEGRFGEAVDSGVHVFANALAEKFAFNMAEIESSPVATNSPEVTTGSGQSVLISASGDQKTRPRTVTEPPKPQSQATPPAETPKSTETPVAESVSSESTKTEPVLNELPKPTSTLTDAVK